MPDIEIYEDTWTKLQEFKKIVNDVIDKPLSNDVDYVNLVLSQGIKKMIQDILPDESEILTTDIVNMFNENPKYISKHFHENLTHGEESKRTKNVKEKWHPYG